MIGVDWSDSETFWLNITNAALGIVTVVALVSLMGALAIEFYERVKKRLAAESLDLHALHVPDLGLTMTDGGERIEKKNAPSSRDLTSTENPQ